MDTASFQFVAFGLAAAILSNFSRLRIWRSVILMLASLVFLGLLAQNPIVFLPLLGFLLLGYAWLMLLERGWSIAWGVAIVLVAYAWLKKYTFLPEALFLHSPYLTLGLSYILFRILQLLIDCGDGDEKRHIGFFNYLLFTLNFTTFVSGPIQRYDDFAKDQFTAEPIPLNVRIVGLQIERIIRGLFKVDVLAMLLNAVKDDSYAELMQPLPLELRLFAAFRLCVVYPFFLYANFSGYIDIVIALARLMRVRLPENFNRPFSASSFLDFWARWHITLSEWLKSYVYNPLLIALMRRVSSIKIEPFLGVICFFVTFFLVGVWHGRTSEFVVFGILQGGGVAINKLWQLRLVSALGRKGYKSLAANPTYIAFGRGLTFTWFAFTLFWFWGNWKQIDAIFTAIPPIAWFAIWIAVWLTATAVLSAWELARMQLLSYTTPEGPAMTSRYARTVYATALALAVFVTTVLLSQPAPDIVYKAF